LGGAYPYTLEDSKPGSVPFRFPSRIGESRKGVKPSSEKVTVIYLKLMLAQLPPVVNQGARALSLSRLSK